VESRSLEAASLNHIYKNPSKCNPKTKLKILKLPIDVRILFTSGYCKPEEIFNKISFKNAARNQ
jgi:hypothetical protein